MTLNELISQLQATVAYDPKAGDLTVVLNDGDGWTVGDIEPDEDDNGDTVMVVYDVAH